MKHQKVSNSDLTALGVYWRALAAASARGSFAPAPCTHHRTHHCTRNDAAHQHHPARAHPHTVKRHTPPPSRTLSDVRQSPTSRHSETQ
eukprot:2265500-Rhodomonas_salina.2